MKDDENRMIRRVIGSLLVLAAVALVGHVNFLGQIPTHGVLLELTTFEWALLAWVAATPVLCHRPGTPSRWWLYYGGICCSILLPVLKDYILYQPGRRPWMPDPNWWLAGSILSAYILLGPWTIAVVWQRRRRDEKA